MQINIILIVITRQWQPGQLLVAMLFVYRNTKYEINKLKIRDTVSSIVTRRMQMVHMKREPNRLFLLI